MNTVNIIGAGRLGKVLAYLIANTSSFKIQAICNAHFESAKQVTDWIGVGVPCTALQTLPFADITFITTPDDVIADIAKQLCAYIQPKSVVVHCSGSLTSDILMALREQGCWLASIHPVKSFADPQLSVNTFQNTFCAAEGDKEALDILFPLFSELGAKPFIIEKSQKKLYHAAAVFASNYVVTLASSALRCYLQAGVEEPLAMQLICSLMQGTVSNLSKTLSPALALTGPIWRGDVDTISQHLQAIDDKQLQTLYRLLGEATLTLTSHSTELLCLLEETLSS